MNTVSSNNNKYKTLNKLTQFLLQFYFIRSFNFIFLCERKIRLMLNSIFAQKSQKHNPLNHEGEGDFYFRNIKIP